jgi:6-phosphogluconate dehydrogenase
MNDKGFNVIAYNRTTSKVDHFLQNEAKGNVHSLPDELTLLIFALT